MQLSIDFISLLLLYFLFGFTVALLELCFQYYQKPGMIFNKYSIWLYSFTDDGDYWATCTHRYQITFGNIMGILNKPLGLCPYCNGTWLAIILFIYYFGLSIDIFLFIGIVWFFIHKLLNNTKNKQKS